MEIISLCLLSAIISRILDKRSKKLNVLFSVFFIFLLSLALFMCDIPFVGESLENIFGHYYTILREALLTQREGFYSAFQILIMMEMVFCIMVLLFASALVVKKISLYVPEAFNCVVEQCGRCFSSVRTVASTNRLFLRLCRIIS